MLSFPPERYVLHLAGHPVKAHLDVVFQKHSLNEKTNAAKGVPIDWKEAFHHIGAQDIRMGSKATEIPTGREGGDLLSSI
jgi:hypothetical protein